MAETNVAHLAPSKVAKVYRQLCATPGQEVVQQTLQVNKNGKFWWRPTTRLLTYTTEITETELAKNLSCEQDWNFVKHMKATL